MIPLGWWYLNIHNIKINKSECSIRILKSQAAVRCSWSQMRFTKLKTSSIASCWFFFFLIAKQFNGSTLRTESLCGNILLCFSSINWSWLPVSLCLSCYPSSGFSPLSSLSNIKEVQCWAYIEWTSIFVQSPSLPASLLPLLSPTLRSTGWSLPSGPLITGARVTHFIVRKSPMSCVCSRGTYEV